MDFVTLTCPNCGGKLQITEDIDRFACGFCGTEHIVKRSGGIVALQPVIEELSKVRAGVDRVQASVDKTASELAIPRIKAEVKDLEDQLQLLQAKRPVFKRKNGLLTLVLIWALLQVSTMVLFMQITDIVSALVLSSIIAGGFVISVPIVLWRSKRVQIRQRKMIKAEIREKQEQLENHRIMVSRRK